jgi:polysaccharide export outer membrane protein
MHSLMTRTAIAAAVAAMAWSPLAAQQSRPVAAPPTTALQPSPAPATPGSPTTPPATETAPAPSPSSAPAAPARLSGTSLPKEYRLGAGDKLRIEVYKDAQLSGPVQIRPDGKITMPLVGDLPAAGQTALELDDTITAALREWVNNPTVSVVVVEATAATAYIYGEVNKPGPITLNGNMTVLQALSMAGGVTPWAKTKKIHILRTGQYGTQTIPFDYSSAMQGMGSPVYLSQGDTVIVPD